MKRLPGLAQIAPVYAVVVMFIYGWTILRFLWKVPSWSYYLSAFEFLSILAYALVVDLLESLAILGLLVLGAALLPRRWLSDVFVSRGTACAAIGLGLLAVCSGSLQTDALTPLPTTVLRFWPAALAFLLAAAFYAGGASRFRSLIENLAERAVVFLFLSIPLSLMALIVVVVRNL